jgi:hypothetical protein
MDRKFPHVISGLALYLLFSAVVGVSTAMRLSVMAPFANWLASSADPRMGLVFLSLLFGGAFMIFLRLGVEFPFFKLNVGEDVKRYVAGLPMWALFLMVAVSALGLLKFAPSCRAPEAVYFEILGTDTQYQPMQTLEVQPGQSLSIAAKSPDSNAQLSCLSWEFVGPAFEKMGEKSGCQVNVQFSQRSGASFLTVVSAQNFCSQKSVFSLEVKLKTP